MRIFSLTVVFIATSILYAHDNTVEVPTTAYEAYELAKKYEQGGEVIEAFFWYKEAAQLILEQNKTVALEQNTQEVIEIESALENAIVVNENLSLSGVSSQPHVELIEDNQSSEHDKLHSELHTIFQAVSSTFGILPYRSNYLLPVTYDFQEHADRKRIETLFQLSVQKPIVENLFGLHGVISLAYTQRSWWQILKNSSPFRETNYAPEIYFAIPHTNENSFIKAYQFGFIHESNGQAGLRSRSWNRIYASLFFQLKDLTIIPRAWYRIKESASEDDNPDIVDYMGYGDLMLILPVKDHMFKAIVRNNFDFKDNRGAVQLDWTFPITKSGLLGYVQYFNGYGESLIDYNHKTNRVSVGFAFSR